MKLLNFHFYAFFILISMFSSCVSLVNLNYETAQILEKGKVSGTASISQDGERSQTLKDTVWSTRELSYGFRFGVGIGEKTNISVRYENTFLKEGVRQNFIEAQFKWALGRDPKNSKHPVRLTLGLPAQYYFYGDYHAVSFNPRLYVGLFNFNPYFRLTLIPKLHLIMDISTPELKFNPIDYPGFSLNLAFSNNFDKWAIIPEIGFLSETDISFGCGFVLKP